MFLKKWVRLKGVGRYACLGAAILETLGRSYKIQNIQKGRVDYLLNAVVDPARICRPAKTIKYLDRPYIAPTIDQQSWFCPEVRPELVFVDSFSELTDQLFRHRQDGWQFCCNFQDINHSTEFSNEFECLGLMNLDTLEVAYDSMLRLIDLRWPGVPVAYIHFPDALETREKFVERARRIREVVEVCALRHSNLYSFSVPNAIVSRPKNVEPGMEDFPYHYSQATYDAFAEMISNHSVFRKYF